VAEVRPGLTLDAGALIQWERKDHRTTALLKGARPRGRLITVPTVVVAQAWRRRPVRIGALLEGCEIEPFTQAHARAAGELLGDSNTTDLVDTAVVLSAARRGDAIVTSDPDDIERLVAFIRKRLVIIPV
jgi:hypothetical protein